MNREFDAKRAAASLNRKFEELGDTLNRSTVAYTPQIRNLDVVRSFQPINDTVLKYANLAEFRLALRSSLESMRLRLQDIHDIPFDSAAEMLRSLASAADEISAMPEDENGNVDASAYANVIEAAEEPVQVCMDENQKKSIRFLKLKNWIAQKVVIINAIAQFINPWATVFHVGWDIYTYNQSSPMTERQVVALESIAKSLEEKANGNYELNIYNQVNVMIETLKSADSEIALEMPDEILKGGD